MRLPISDATPSRLAEFGWEVIDLVRGGKFAEIADRFGYALASGADPTEAIIIAFRDCVTFVDGMPQIPQGDADVEVGLFAPKDDNLFAAISCALPLDCSSRQLLIELVALTIGDEVAVTLEQISCV